MSPFHWTIPPKEKSTGVLKQYTVSSYPVGITIA